MCCRLEKIYAGRLDQIRRDYYVEAEETISGTVVNVDPDTGNIMILLDDASGYATISPGSRNTGSSLSVGTHIVARGAFKPGAPTLFKARHIKSGKRQGGKSDPTGVRSRLLKGFSP